MPLLLPTNAKANAIAAAQSATAAATSASSAATSAAAAAASAASAGGGGGGGGAAEFQLITVGRTGSGAMLICDGVADDVQIQQAVTTATTAGGGVIRIFAGLYDIRNTIVVPKDPKIRIEGQYTTKSGYGGTTLQAGATLTAIIRESGTSPASTSNADHSHASQYSRLVFDGQGTTTAGLLLINTDHQIVNDCKFVGVQYGIDGQFNGDVTISDYAGGLRVQGSSFYASVCGIQLDRHTQDWITDNWFLGVPTMCHIRFNRCNKIHLSNNEFNTVATGGSIFIFDDNAAAGSGNQCGDINITGGFMNAGAGNNFWTDNRTNTSSKGVIVSGVRQVAGVLTRLFQQAKNYQGVTYTTSNKVNNVVPVDFNDQVILANGSSGTVPLQLPSAANAVHNIWVKAISVTNACTITPNGTDQIEQAGVLGSLFTFGEVNESVLLTPDTNKWRVLENYKPSGSTPTVTADSVTEISSASYTLTTATDVLIVNPSSNAVAITLPTKASKFAAARKSVVIKVISATNPVTVTGASAEEIDLAGQTSITIQDLRAVTFYATSGARWRTATSYPPNRVTTFASGATITPNADASDVYAVTGLTTAATIAAPSGTPQNGQLLRLRIIDTGTARALTWNAIWRPIGVTLPTTTVASKLLYVTAIYNSASTKWDVLQVAQEG